MTDRWRNWLTAGALFSVGLAVLQWEHIPTAERLGGAAIYFVLAWANWIETY